MASEVLDWSLTRVAAAIAAREVSSTEVTAAVLDRIAAENSSTHTFITVTPEQALSQAQAADAALARGDTPGPLHGVPVAIKDLIDVAGVRTTCGARILQGAPPAAADASVTQRLVAAGAVIVGKTNLHPFGYGITNENPTFGSPPNPYDPMRTPGGSSGGSAVAVACRQCYGALGSDTGGSIRLPAAWCGIVGLKPTYGRVSRVGIFPLAWSLDQVGPMTRSVADAAAMLQAIAGHDPGDPASVPAPVPDYRSALDTSVAGLRLGVVAEWFWDDADPEVAAACEAAAVALVSLGMTRRTVHWPLVRHAAHTMSAIIYAESATVHATWLRERLDDYEPFVRDRLLRAALTPAVDYVQAQRLRRALLEEALEIFRTVNVLLTPTALRPAPRWDESASSWGTHNTAPFNLTGLPTISVPYGHTCAGLPIGVQITAAPFAEATALRVAEALEQVLGD